MDKAAKAVFVRHFFGQAARFGHSRPTRSELPGSSRSVFCTVGRSFIHANRQISRGTEFVAAGEHPVPVLRQALRKLVLWLSSGVGPHENAQMIR